MNSLNDRDMALLHTRFVVPLSVGRMLRGAEPCDEAAEFAMNMMLSELQPDAGLLCLALCGQHVAAHGDTTPAGRMLRMQADRIADTLGALWLARQRKQRMPADEVAAILAAMPDDLKILSDLFSSIAERGRHLNTAINRLCFVLAAQAGAHHAYTVAGSGAKHAPAEGLIRQVVATVGNIVAFPCRWAH